MFKSLLSGYGFLLALMAAATTLAEAVAPATPAKLVARQATREQVIARGLQARHGLIRRTPAPSPVLGPCGIPEDLRFVVRFVHPVGDGRFTPNNPGYLSLPSSEWPDTMGSVGQDLNTARLMTLDSNDNCALVALVPDYQAGRKLKAIPEHAAGDIGAHPAFAPADDSYWLNFPKLSCTVSNQGDLHCMLQDSPVKFGALPHPANSEDEILNAGLLVCTNTLGYCAGESVKSSILAV